MTNEPQKITQNNEISILEIILSLKKIITLVFLHKYKVILFGLIGAAIGLLIAFQSPIVYTAELTFAIEEKSGGASAYAGIASQFGLDLGRGEGGAFAGDNIMELFKSRLIIQKTLLTIVDIEGNKDLLINRFIKSYNLDKKWANSETLANFKFDALNPSKNQTRVHDSVVISISEIIKRDLLRIEKIDKKLAIIKINVTSTDDVFAKYFTEVQAKNVKELYIENKTKKSKANIAVLEARVDSVRSELYSDMSSVASNQDQNLNVVKAQVRIPQAKRQINIQLLTALYAELIKNLELSKLTLEKEEPVIQLIDKPMFPLKYKKTGKLVSLIIGGFLGGFFYIGFLLTKNWYKQLKLQLEQTSKSAEE